MRLRPPQSPDPGDLFDDDVTRPATAHARLRRNYLALLGPILLIGSIAAFGAIGRVTSPPGPRPSESAIGPDPVPSAAVVAPTSAPSSGVAVAMGSDLTRSSVAASGRRLFYVVGTKTLESLSLVAGARPVPLVTVDQCEGIHGLAASGLTLLYVVAKAATPPSTSTCGEPTRIAWTIWAIDLVSGGRRALASGERSDTPTTRAFPPVHIAVSQSSFAFERPRLTGLATPPPLAGESVEVVEVHSLADGALEWRTTVPGPIARLMLGGSRLAIETDDPARRLFVANAANREPALIARPSSGSALSFDGRYLSWDAASPSAGVGRLAVFLRDLTTGQDRVVGVDGGPPTGDVVEPAVGATARGPEVAWFDLFGHGLVPAFVDPGHPRGGHLVSVQQPVWMSIQGDDLVWIVTDPDGDSSVAFVADLPTTAAGDPDAASAP